MRIRINGSGATGVRQIMVGTLVVPDFMGEGVVAGGTAVVYDTESARMRSSLTNWSCDKQCHNIARSSSIRLTTSAP